MNEFSWINIRSGVCKIIISKNKEQWFLLKIEVLKGIEIGLKKISILFLVISVEILFSKGKN